jgi:Tfp pilus assembly protein PilO
VITKKQQKLLMMMGIIIIGIIVFIIFMYLPLRRKWGSLQNELNNMEVEIGKIKSSVAEEKSLEDSIVVMRNELAAIYKKFPDKEEITLRELSSLATKLGIEIVAMKPQKKNIVKELAGEKINIKGCVVQDMPITMYLRTDYKTLGEFFKSLKTDFPVFVKIGGVKMVRIGDKMPGLLDISLDLDTYFLCPE